MDVQISGRYSYTKTWDVVYVPLKSRGAIALYTAYVIADNLKIQQQFFKVGNSIFREELLIKLSYICNCKCSHL